MTQPKSPALDARLLDQASEWVARVHDDDASEADWLALEVWLAADRRHGLAYERAEMMWADLGDLAQEIAPALAPDAPESVVVDFTARRTRKPSPRWIFPAAAAASVLVAVGLFGAFSGPTVQVYDTAPGETRMIALDDGTRINLNGASHIEIRMGRRARKVEMAQAEASFDVAHDADRPFTVAVGEDTVRVVGTEFNIRRDQAQTTVAVRRGVVEVKPATGAAQPVRLPAGTTYERFDGSAQATVIKVSADAAFAWGTGRLVYDDQPLSRVVADLSRRFRTPLTVDDSAGQLRFTGVLVLDDEANVISRLEAFLPITAHRSATGIRLTLKAKAG